jgi:hypothetical protein
VVLTHASILSNLQSVQVISEGVIIVSSNLIQWAFKYGVDLNAMLELREIFNADGLGSMPLGA